MIERREFISICRQIGTMMEVGVDFLRITSALRSQTDNPRLLQLYEQLDEDLRAGDSLSDAMSHAPDVFSPFAVSLIRQGEARGDIEGAWARVADFYKVEAREDIELGDNAGALEPIGARFRGGSGASSSNRGRGFAGTSEVFERAQRVFVSICLGLALLLAILGLVRAGVELGTIPRSAEALWELGASALFFGVVGAVGTLRKPDKASGTNCAFCGRLEGEDVVLSFAWDDKTAICSVCAGQIAAETPRTQQQRADNERERDLALRGVADALPTEGAPLDDTIILADDDPLAPTR